LRKRRTRRPGAEVDGARVTELPSVSSETHCRRGIFADADAIARRKVRWRAISLGCECLRNAVAGISFANASPQKSGARASGADRVASVHSASLHFQAVRPSRHNHCGIFADVDAVARRKVR